MTFARTKSQKWPSRPSVNPSRLVVHSEIKEKPPEPKKLQPVFLCPYSGNNYAGKCQIKRCWAHLNSHPSGCARQMLCKPQYGIAELSYIFSKERKDVKNRVESGLAMTKVAISLVQEMEDLVNTTVNSCELCGRIRKSGRFCFNKIKCDKRKVVLAEFCKHGFFIDRTYPELNQLLAKESNREKVAELFGLSGREREHLLELFTNEENK